PFSLCCLRVPLTNRVVREHVDGPYTLQQLRTLPALAHLGMALSERCYNTATVAALLYVREREPLETATLGTDCLLDGVGSIFRPHPMRRNVMVLMRAGVWHVRL